MTEPDKKKVIEFAAEIVTTYFIHLTQDEIKEWLTAVYDLVPVQEHFRAVGMNLDSVIALEPYMAQVKTIYRLTAINAERREAT